MKCVNCEAIMPPTYKACPNCGSPYLVRETFIITPVATEIVEPITAEVIASEMSLSDMNGN